MTSVIEGPQSPIQETAAAARQARQRSVWDPAIVRRALWESFVKLDPRYMIGKPVMFVVEVGSVWVMVLFFTTVGTSTAAENVFDALVILFLWFTVLFGTFADAIAEGRGKAQADTLRRTRQETSARVRQPDGSTRKVPSTQLKIGDECIVLAGELIPGDGDVIEGMALPVLVSVATKTSPDSKAEPAVAVGAPKATTDPLADMPMFVPAANAALVVFLGGSTSLAWVKVPRDSVNTNAAPLRSLMPDWPTATISPLLETATESPPPWSGAVCFQVLAPVALVNTSVRPFWASPNAIVEPLEEIAESSPRRAKVSLDSVSFCACT
jgi:hypothetical protein